MKKGVNKYQWQLTEILPSSWEHLKTVGNSERGFNTVASNVVSAVRGWRVTEVITEAPDGTLWRWVWAIDTWGKQSGGLCTTPVAQVKRVEVQTVDVKWVPVSD